MNQVEFEYKPDFSKFVPGLLFFFLLFASFIYLATINEAGVKIGNMVLSPVATTLLYVVISLVFMVAFINSMIIFTLSLSNRKIKVDNQFISAPKSAVSKKVAKIYYNKVSHVYCRCGERNSHSIILFSENDILLKIPSNMIATEKNFDKLCKILKNKIAESGVPPQE